tara:strand:- start:28 stop:198 length:171 start_codon:yes stop_codon:yes gene_type:complete
MIEGFILIGAACSVFGGLLAHGKDLIGEIGAYLCCFGFIVLFVAIISRGISMIIGA